MNTKELIEAVKNEKWSAFHNCADCECGIHNDEVIEKLNHLAELEDKIEQGLMKEEKTCIFEEWQDNWSETTAWQCSNCTEDFYFLEGGAIENMYQYCPHCGARVTEYKEVEDGEAD